MTDPKINLTQLREWIEAAKPTPDTTNDQGQPIYTDAALLAEDRLVVALLNGGALALIDTAQLLRRIRQWDALNPPIDAPYGDATYWVSEIDRALNRFTHE